MTTKAQRQALLAAVRRHFPDAKVECSDLPWLSVPGPGRMDGALAKIFVVLQKHRGHTDFATAGRRLVCDIVIPSQKLIIEYDERQHFTEPRRIALAHYPKDMAVGFDTAKWIAYCKEIAAHDNDPPYRDEQRAYYDSVRDILASANGYRVIRLKHGAVDWQTCNTEGEITNLMSIRSSLKHSGNPPSPALVTVCIEGNYAQHVTTNEKRLKLVGRLAREIDKKWTNLDAIVFPGGFLRLPESVGHLSYDDRVKKLKAAGFVTPITGAIKALDHSRGVLIVFGVDGPNYRNRRAGNGDQLCVAADESGIVGIARKIFPVSGDEAGGDEAESLLCCDADFKEKDVSSIFRVAEKQFCRPATICSASQSAAT